MDAGGKVVAPAVALAWSGSGKGTLNLNSIPGSRGVLEAGQVFEESGTGGGKINFHGGILRATGNHTDFLYGFETGDLEILSSYAFIDSNGYNIGISTALQGSSGGGLVKQGAGTLTLSGDSSYNGDTELQGGTLQISSGGSVSDTRGVIGSGVGTSSTVTVTGSGSQWTSSSLLYVGNDGSGTLNVQAGGTVSSAIAILGRFTGSTGSATITGTGTEWISADDLRVGNEGSGTLSILSGGKASSLAGVVGTHAGSTGTATVNGAGSQWNNSQVFYVGYLGVGTLHIQNGGAASSPYGTIGRYGGSVGEVNVTGTGSQWTMSNDLEVGTEGTGTLNIQNGGKVTNNRAYIAFYSGITGTVNVSGSGSQWLNSGNLEIARSGTGTLTVSDGGKVTASAVLMAVAGNAKGTLILNGTAGSRGVLETGYLSEGAGTQGARINIEGGILRATGNQSNFLQNFETGDVQLLAGGAFVDTQGFNVGISTSLQGAGGLTKQGTGTLTLSGASGYAGTTTVAAGTLEVTGSLSGSVAVQSTGTLSGTGTVQGVTLESGAKISPGAGPVGILSTQGETWYGGGTYVWDVNATSGTPGTNWDLISVTGALNIAATSGDTFTLEIHGSLSGLDFYEAYDWTVLTATGGFGGTFDASKFALDALGFASNTGGEFSIRTLGNDLVLHYATVPEPASAALLAVGGGWLRMRRRPCSERRGA